MRNFYLIVNREKPRVEEAAGLICSFSGGTEDSTVWHQYGASGVSDADRA